MLGETGAKRKKALRFYEESALLIRSCLPRPARSTLNSNSIPKLVRRRPDLAALRQLTTIGSVPVATVRSLRLPASAAEENKLAALESHLAQLKRRNFLQSLEVSLALDRLPGPAFWDLLRQTEIPLNLLWPSGPAEMLRRLLEVARPRSVFCPVELNHSECAALAQSPALAVFSPCKELLGRTRKPIC